jgi:hypothetical protein
MKLEILLGQLFILLSDSKSFLKNEIVVAVEFGRKRLKINGWSKINVRPDGATKTNEWPFFVFFCFSVFFWSRPTVTFFPQQSLYLHVMSSYSDSLSILMSSCLYVCTQTCIEIFLRKKAERNIIKFTSYNTDYN